MQPGCPMPSRAGGLLSRHWPAWQHSARCESAGRNADGMRGLDTVPPSSSTFEAPVGCLAARLHCGPGCDPCVEVQAAAGCSGPHSALLAEEDSARSSGAAQTEPETLGAMHPVLVALAPGPLPEGRGTCPRAGRSGPHSAALAEEGGARGSSSVETELAACSATHPVLVAPAPGPLPEGRGTRPRAGPEALSSGIAAPGRGATLGRRARGPALGVPRLRLHERGVADALRAL